jgi:hypothetical protein
MHARRSFRSHPLLPGRSGQGRLRIVQGTAAGFCMYLIAEVIFPSLDGIAFRLDAVDLAYWTCFGSLFGLWHAYESEAHSAVRISDFNALH